MSQANYFQVHEYTTTILDRIQTSDFTPESDPACFITGCVNFFWKDTVPVLKKNKPEQKWWS